MEQGQFLASGSGQSSSSSGSHTLSEGEDTSTAALDIKVYLGEDDGNSLEFESVNDAEDAGNARYDKETLDDEDDEEDDKVNREECKAD